MKLTRQMLLDAKACPAGLASFEARVAGKDGYEWTEEEAQRIQMQNPRFLKWLERKKLVPMLEAEGLPSVAARTLALRPPRERLRSSPARGRVR